MPAVISNKFRIFNAEQFKESFTEAANTILYFYIGGNGSFVDDLNPQSPGTATSNTEVQPWTDMYAAKRILSGDVSHVIPRYNWTSGQTYTEYNDIGTNILSDTFYVVTDEYNVYKCLSNNSSPVNTSGVPSVYKPSGSSSNTVITTADGYVWKYMYTISTADALKFLTTTHIPVKYLESDDGSPQWQVQTDATPGAIEIIKVTSGGSGYDFAPTVTIIGDGDGATATAAISANTVTSITMTNRGSGYTNATVVFSGGGSPTVAATARAIISPKDGHGSNPVKELGGAFILMNVRLDGNESDTFSTTNDFRKIGIVKDPLEYSTSSRATNSVYRQTFRYELSSLTGSEFFSDQVVSFGANTASVVEYVPADGGDPPYLYTTLPSPKLFEVGNTISSATASATIAAITTPGLKPYSGEVIYMENRIAVTRSSNQVEDVKLIVEF